MTRRNDWDHLDNAPLGIIPPGMPDAPRFPDAALRYGSYRDRELSKTDWDWYYYGFWFSIGFPAITFALWRWWFVAVAAS